jgi:uncharacterized protein (TIRG00374 family)
VALVGLGYGSFFWKAIVAQLVIQILLPFVPTPGGSGIGEVGFLFVYKSILPDVGVATLLTLIWRFIDFYLGLLLGGAAFILIMRDLSKSSRIEPGGDKGDGKDKDREDATAAGSDEAGSEDEESTPGRLV